MSCIFKIKEGFNSFTNTEKKLAEYILNNSKKVVSLSAQELAKNANISPAAVVRFSKSLGYKGFTALKVDLARNSGENEKEIDITIEPDESTEAIVKKIGKSNTNTIKETLNLINIEKISSAIDILCNAKNIYLFGIGASGLVAIDFQYKLLRINKQVVYQNDPHIQLASSVHIGSGDVALGISYGGESKEVNLGIKKAKENGAKTIAITKYNKNTLSKLGDIVLYLPNEEKELRLGAISSRIAALTLTDILFLGIAREDFYTMEEHLIDTREMIQQLK
ncbi:MurR/RpiR family transcriptional regulator [Clostridium septicum]|uniref:MurR/RpiR family transcriptional regulator n=1 Tax=Clostridium septicum TaxID=1504 RepID=A0A9N7JLH5_CLOSE|nr:MurR/RpiR family transcriptional regulator [Clostridium septicum]AYE34056.1 MurR/RpiR family transcriptional regulator [Clostridium septicum]MDU1313553.1 MurR/RpiR family transcriptional regulator [Clostridium septicum]QAS59427.1 MurR/RpiR family transcriptional regulator [Clostridium septicum]UEC21319.1 MurR/RpiR family transcriptional regulator [Clostridium septicum]USS00636.1 MurR/RpiR family transcriptional regulator [Clostridium septicum]